MPDSGGEKKLEYVIMPDLGGGPPGSRSGFSLGSLGPRARLFLVIVVGGLVLAGIVIAIFKLFSGRQEAQPTPPISVNEQAGGQGAGEDTDSDGLNDSEEESFGTEPDNPDTDEDGLADGDEINIYGSDPKLADSDADTFPDGREVARGYSPIQNSSDKAEAAERQLWLSNSIKYGLHEPTVTTLKTETEQNPNAQSQTIPYTNSLYNYSIAYPAELQLREERGGQVVGLSISASEPNDDISQDTFVIALAGTKEILTLQEWAQTQYSPNDYSFVATTTNGIPALRVSPKNTQECAEDRTFISKQNLIISVTWNCSSTSLLEQYYLSIVSSFKFLK